MGETHGPSSRRVSPHLAGALTPAPHAGRQTCVQGPPGGRHDRTGPQAIRREKAERLRNRGAVKMMGLEERGGFDDQRPQ